MMQQHPYHPVLQVSKLNAACSTDIFRVERKVCDVCTFVRLDIKDDKNKTEYADHFYNTASKAKFTEILRTLKNDENVEQ